VAGFCQHSNFGFHKGGRSFLTRWVPVSFSMGTLFPEVSWFVTGKSV